MHSAMEQCAIVLMAIIGTELIAVLLNLFHIWNNLKKGHESCSFCLLEVTFFPFFHSKAELNGVYISSDCYNGDCHPVDI
jgi:hypothetical protein